MDDWLWALAIAFTATFLISVIGLVAWLVISALNERSIKKIFRGTQTSTQSQYVIAMSVLAMLVGALITGVFVFMTFRIDYGVKNEVRELVREQIEEALNHYEQRIATMVQKGEVTIQKWDELYQGVQTSQSDIEETERALPQKPHVQNTYNDWIVYGNSKYNDNEYSTALEAFQQALEKASSAEQVTKALVNKGITLMRISSIVMRAIPHQ